MGLLVFLLGFGFKQLWDQHLIQPHLEEATIYLQPDRLYLWAYCAPQVWFLQVNL